MYRLARKISSWLTDAVPVSVTFVFQEVSLFPEKRFVYSDSASVFSTRIRGSQLPEDTRGQGRPIASVSLFLVMPPHPGSDRPLSGLPAHPVSMFLDSCDRLSASRSAVLLRWRAPAVGD